MLYGFVQKTKIQNKMKKILKKLFSIVLLSFCSGCVSAQTPVPENTSEPGFDISNQNGGRPYAEFYPNPVTGNIVKIKSCKAIKTVEILNIIGKCIQLVSNTYNIYDDMTIVLQDYEPGMYLAKITFEDDRTIVKKLVIK